MKRIVCALLAISLLFGLAACSNTEKDWQEQYDLGMRYLDDGDYEEAILAFSAAIEIDSSRPEAYMGRAEAYIAIGEPEKALRDYKRARRAAQDSDEDYGDLIDELEEIIGELDEEEKAEDTPATANKLTRVLQYSNQGGSSYLWRVYRLTYDSLGTLFSRTVEEYAEDGTLMNTRVESYAFDAAGRITGEWVPTDGTCYRSYTYDEAGKLVSWESMGTEFLLTYDDQGNLLRRETTDGYETVEYTCENGRILSATATYDVGDRYTYTFTYDDQGRMATEDMVGEVYSTQTTYCYDYPGLVAYRISTTMLESSFNIAMWDSYGNYIWSMAMGADSELTVEDGYLTMVEDTSEWYGPSTYILFYDEDEAEALPTPQPAADAYTIYKDYFYAHYTAEDRVYLADVTHDGEDELLVVHLSDAEGSEIYGHVYTIVDGQVREIYTNSGSAFHAGGFYAWYLTYDETAGAYNLCQESFGMWQGYGTLSYWEYMVNPDGTTVNVYELSVESNDAPIEEARFTAYVEALSQRLSNCGTLYCTYSEGGGAPLLDTDPASVFDH